MMPPPDYQLDVDSLVEEALEAGEPNRPTTSYCYGPLPLLQITATSGRLDLVDILWEAGARLSADDLASVCYWGSEETVRLLLSWGVPHNAGCVATVVRSGRWNILFDLIDFGVDVRTPISVPGGKATFLHAAAWANEGAAVRKLLERGAEVDKRDSDGMTPLMKACDAGAGQTYLSIDSVFWLLRAGADPNAVSFDGETALLLCATLSRPRLPDGRVQPRQNPVFVEERQRHVYNRGATATMLLRAGADPNVMSRAGTTPLMLAAREDNADMARRLLRAGADAALKSPAGLTAYDVAAKWESPTVRQLLAAA